MANTFDLQVLNDGHRNAIVRISAVLDTSDADLTISLDTFTNNDVQGGQTLRGLRLDSIDNQIGSGLQVQLYWAAAVDQLMFTAVGQHETCFKDHGGLVPDMSALGFNGNVKVKTIGFNIFQEPPQTFSLVLRFVKLYT